MGKLDSKRILVFAATSLFLCFLCVTIMFSFFKNGQEAKIYELCCSEKYSDRLSPCLEHQKSKFLTSSSKLLSDPGKQEERICISRRYGDNNQFELTALASLPGSGNTWLRHLIEQATGTLSFA